MARANRREPFAIRWVVTLLVGAIMVPTLLSVSAGIVSLALWTDAADIVIGVLVISFASTVVGASIATLVVLVRWNRLARLQTDFVANVSHELRTPLTAIKLLVETLHLGRAQEPKDLRRCLDALTEETERLSQLIERILQWRRMDAGAVRYARRPERVEDIVDQALRPLPGTKPDRGPALVLESEPGLPAVLADREALAEALRNVLQNAIKYGGGETPVTLELTAVEGGRAVCIRVRDRGPGIPKAEIKQIFERFYRGEAVREDARLPGTGLGLSIARHVVEAHGGRIEIESHLGWGTCLELTLPAAPDPGPQHEPSQA